MFWFPSSQVMQKVQWHVVGGWKRAMKWPGDSNCVPCICVRKFCSGFSASHSFPSVLEKRTREGREQTAQWTLKKCSFKENTNVSPRGKPTLGSPARAFRQKTITR